MKKLESSFMNMALVLFLISVVAAGLLAYVNGVTSEPIAQINEKTLSDGIKLVLQVAPEEEIAVKESEKEAFKFFEVTRPDGAYVGTAVQSTDKSGFGGDIQVLVGFDKEGTILGYEVLKHAETPGLGARANEWFRTASSQEVKPVSAVNKVFFGNPAPAGKHNIVGMNPGNSKLSVSKDGGDIDAITASTITSRAFLRAVSNAYNAFKGNAADAHSGATPKTEPATVNGSQN